VTIIEEKKEAVSVLKGKVVCVTGASRGLGMAIARAFDACGARLVVGARTQSAVDELAGELDNAIAVQCDVRVASDLVDMVDAAVGEFGRIDVMVNNAGVAIYGPLSSTDVEAVNSMIDTNLKGVIFGSQAAFAVMRKQRDGHIVNISSIAGKLHLKNEAVYSATKWGVNGFTGALSLEGRKHGVKATAVCPGGINTPFWKEMDFHPFSDRVDPERDFMSPEEVAQSVVNLVATSKGFAVQEVVLAPLF